MPLAILNHTPTNHAINAGRTVPMNTKDTGGLYGRDFKSKELDQTVQLTIRLRGTTRLDIDVA